MFSDQPQLFRFGRLVRSVQNTGHLMIEEGFKSLNLNLTQNILSLWNPNIGNSKCSCKRFRMQPEALLATSIISHQTEFMTNNDFPVMYSRLEHLMNSHNIRAVVGLGINDFMGRHVTFENLPITQRNFLDHLRSNNVSIGCRGNESQEFLLTNGFERQNLFLTGCPSLQLIKPFSKKLTKEFSRILVNGALIKRLDLIQSLTTNETKILFIPQSIDEFKIGLEQSNSDNRIEIFLPSNYSEWIGKLTEWDPEMSVGTRLHSNIAALSIGIPSVHMSGDIRSMEISQVSKLPYSDDLMELGLAVENFSEYDGTYRLRIPEILSLEIQFCLREFID